jgi:hypothetical protein
MRKVETIKFGDFMAGENRAARRSKAPKPRAAKRNGLAIVKRVGLSVGVPLVFAKPAFASAGVSAVTANAVPVGAGAWMGEKTLEAFAHMMDPVIDVLVAMSFPVASVIIVGALFFFMFGNSEKAWTMIQNAGLGYVLIQVSPLILTVLKSIGSAM